MIDPKKRLVSDPPDEFKPTSVKIRLAGYLVHETILEIDPSLIPHKGDQIGLPDGSGRLAQVNYRIYQLNGRGELIITLMLET